MEVTKTNPTTDYRSNSQLRDTMFYEIGDTSTTILTTADAATPSNTMVTTTTKKHSLISRRILSRAPSLRSTLPLPLPTSDYFYKRRPLLPKYGRSTSSNTTRSGGFAELAGGATAECAAVCCCCPCGLAHLLYLTVYKLPAGLCRRALRRSRMKKLIKKGVLLPPKTKRYHCGCDQTELKVHPVFGRSDSDIMMTGKFDGDDSGGENSDDDQVKEDDNMTKLEKEMWEKFFGTGFWRSPSQREISGILIEESE